MTGPSPTPSPTTSGAERDGRTEPDGAPVQSWGWHLMQVTSWLLLVMLPIQVFTTFVLHDPAHAGAALFVERWHGGGWRIFDWLFLMLALAHGGVGLHRLVAPLVADRRARQAIGVALLLALGALAIVASDVIFTFDVL